MSNSHKKQLINNTLWVYAGKIITQVIGLVATILVIRKLPVETYGAYTFLFGLFFVYQLFITSPIKNVILRYVPELVVARSYVIVRKLVLYSHFFAIAFIGLFSFLLYIFQEDFASFFNFPDFKIYFAAFIVFVFCYALKVMSETIIASFLKHPISAKANVVVVVVRSSLYLYFLSDISVDLLLYVEALVSVLFFVIVLRAMIAELVKKDAEVQEQGTELGLIKNRVLRFYSLSFFSELGYGIIGKTSDQYIIAAISSPFYVGLYGFALKIYEMFYKVLPFREFESVLKPVFFKRFSKTTDDREINAFYNFSIKVLLPLFIFPVLYFFIFGKGIIIHVFEAKYLPAYWVACVSLFGLIFQGLFYPLNLVIQLKERVEINLYSRIVVIFSIAAGVYAMQYWGIVGVAAATVTGELLKNLLMLFMIRKYQIIKYDKVLLIRYGFISILMLIVFVPFMVNLESVLGLLLGSMIFSFLWLLLLINFHPLNDLEVTKLKEVLAGNKRIKKILKPLASLLRVVILIK
ncbi:lipopolysaccharide biosynthesis protein [Labilibacter marinus]|uniref:lipopolysaccharide biosynthesis protein n=1 Tax=Labilibacter marinus TaxID=1477105 RepID=UPI00082BC77C|nr:polysaccharide biosynthesis C-terminal domain-containing protein [Labilibacter marinus]